jgi:hypothetical protein
MNWTWCYPESPFRSRECELGARHTPKNDQRLRPAKGLLIRVFSMGNPKYL